MMLHAWATVTVPFDPFLPKLCKFSFLIWTKTSLNNCKQWWRISPNIANHWKMYILDKLQLYRKIYAAELPIGYKIGNAIPSRSTRAFISSQEVEGGGLVSAPIPESLVSLCIRVWPVRHLWVMAGHLWCGSYSWPLLSMFQDFENFWPLHTK